MAWQGNGMGTAWAWHAMCESALTGLVTSCVGTAFEYTLLKEREGEVYK